MKKEIKNWTLYLSRPFSLFQSSLWNQWYFSELGKRLLGVHIKNVLYIENPVGVANNYRIKKELDRYYDSIRSLAIKKPQHYISMLQEAVSLNKQADSIIKDGKKYGLKESVDFLTKLAILGTILPYRGGDYNVQDKRIIKLIRKLRSVSYYPNFMEKVVIPAAQRQLIKIGIKDKNAVKVITIKELLSKKKINIKKRLADLRVGKKFIYQSSNGRENIKWAKNNESLVNQIEKINNESNSLRGSCAYKGLVRGVVKMILTNKVTRKDFKKFNKGDILVAIYTSPNLMPFIKKCSAIVTNEGGLTCHAAIISRELKIPCVIGTKVATKLLKDGDLVEVDANQGTVKILKSV